MAKKLTYEEQLSLIKDKNDGFKVKELSEKYNIAEVTAYNIIRRGAKEYKVANKKYTVNDNYFKTIDNEEKAYWLGFLYADGYVRMKYERSGELRLKLGIKDREHIELFTKCLESNHPIKDTESTVFVNGKEHKSDVSLVSIYNTKIVKDLYEHGCTNAKTFTIEFPELREDLVRHFIRGYFDGDGHISIKKNRKNAIAGLTSGSDLFIEYLNKHFIENGIEFKISINNNCKILYVYRYDDILNLYNYLYKDSNINLYRKKEKFIEYLQ